MRAIDADALVEAVNDYPYGFRGMIVCDIAKQPTLEPKRGKWITKKDACGIGYQICSNCETEIQWRDRRGVMLRVDMQNAPYCPNCGAKMERSEE